MRRPSQWAYNIRNSIKLLELGRQIGCHPDSLITTKEGRKGGTYIHPVLYTFFWNWLTGNLVKEKPSIVYAVSAVGTGRIKIGVTADINHVLVKIQSYCPVKIKVLRAVETPRALDIESTLAIILGEFRKHGKWFEVEEGFLLDAIDQLCSRTNS